MYNILYISLIYIVVQLGLVIVIGKYINSNGHIPSLFIYCFLLCSPLSLIAYSVTYALYDHTSHSDLYLLVQPLIPVLQIILICVPWYLFLKFLDALRGIRG